ncbi:MAG: VanW family protein [Eubacterium sp.]|nr:VanW family protein [Eubacterium sp.]
MKPEESKKTGLHKTAEKPVAAEQSRTNSRGAMVLLVMIAVMVGLGITYIVLSTRGSNAEQSRQTEMESVVNPHLSTAFGNKWLGDEDLEGKDETYIRRRLEEIIDRYNSRTVTIRIGKKHQYTYSMKDLNETIQFVCKESGGETGYSAGREDALAKHIVSLDKDLPIKDQYDIINGKRQTKQAHIELQCIPDKNEVTKIVKKYSEIFDVAPKNATIKKDFSITKERDGRVLDTAKIAGDLNDYLSSDETNDFSRIYKTSPVKATVKASYLKKINTVIGSMSTVFIPTNVRGENIKLAASRVDGKLLNPGESISFLDTLYDDSDGKSYGKAGGFLNNKVVQVEGGGICQVSTTAYDAFLFAGIIPKERYPHTCRVSYVKPGFDAALAVGVKDLVVENTLDCPLMIRAYTKESKLYVAIYSYKDAKGGNTYKLRSKTEGDGLTVESFLDVYQGDTLIETRALAVDTYKRLRSG